MSELPMIHDEMTNPNKEKGSQRESEAIPEFDAENARRLAQVEKTNLYKASEADARDNSLSAARARVNEAIRRRNDSKKKAGVLRLEDQSLRRYNSKQDKPKSFIKTISDIYDSRERSRIDRIKAEINENNIADYEFRKLAPKSNTVQKVSRLFMDFFRIRPKRSEQVREREAIYIALNERRAEEEKAWASMDAEIRREEEARAKKKAEREKQNAEDLARMEECELARDMASFREQSDRRKTERYRKQRIQESIERNLNSRLLTVDYLETQIASENPEVQKRVIRWRKHDIPVYDLKGLPFSVLSHTVDYRNTPDPVFTIGTETYKTVMKNPWVWSRRLDEVESMNGFGTKESNAMGNMVSASFWNSERNIDSHYPGELIYGFEHVEGNSVISIFNRDGGTDNMMGSCETDLSNPDIIKQLEGADGREGYNEVALRRYTENGMPRKPDYIIVENGNITEAAYRSAAFFNIPIINIDKPIYERKAEERSEELINSISEKDSYEELDRKIAELLSMSMNKAITWELNHAEVGLRRPLGSRGLLPFQQKCLEKSKIEQEKRINFIREALEEASKKLETATKKGVFIEESLPQFDFFNISETSQREGAPFNVIEIKYRLKGSTRTVQTDVYDGARVPKSYNGITIEYTDSIFYDALEPIIRKYIEARERNQRIA